MLHHSKTGAGLIRNFSSNLAGRASMSTARALSSSQEAAPMFMLVHAGEDMSLDHAGPGYMPWLRSLRPKKVTLLIQIPPSQFRLVK